VSDSTDCFALQLKTTDMAYIPLQHKEFPWLYTAGPLGLISSMMTTPKKKKSSKKGDKRDLSCPETRREIENFFIFNPFFINILNITPPNTYLHQDSHPSHSSMPA
jgi:hypothetical protein